MAFLINTSSKNIVNGCYLDGKNIAFSFESDIWFDTNVGPYTLTLTVKNANNEVVFTTAENVLNKAAFNALVIESAFETGLYTVDVLVIDTLTLEETDSVQYYDVCPVFELRKDSCYQYTLYRPTGVLVPALPSDDLSFKVSLTNYNGTDVMLEQTWDVVATDTLSLNLIEDGVYLLSLEGLNTGTISYFPIYEFCQLEYCYIKAFQSLYCQKEDCNDCENSDDKIAMEKKRYFLNKMVSMGAILFSTVFKDRLGYLGILCVDDCRELDIKNIDDIFKKINELLSNCGNCFDGNCVEDFKKDCDCINKELSILFTETIYSNN